MKIEHVPAFLCEMKSFIRDMKLNSMLVNSKTVLEVPKKKSLPFLYKGYKKINELNKLDAIITGSRALAFYSIKGVPLITRKLNDWDFILNKKSFYEFCSKNNLSNFFFDKDTISLHLESGLYIGSYGYHEKRKSYILKHDFDIIASDNLPNYHECRDFKVAPIEYILSEKIAIIENQCKTLRFVYSDTEIQKHIRDCLEVMVKLRTSEDISDAVNCFKLLNDYDEISTENLNYMLKVLN